MVRPPAAAIRDLLVFGGSEGLGEISRPRWGPEMAVLAVTRRHRGVSGIFLAHRNRVRVPRLPMFRPPAAAIRDLQDT